MSASATQGGHNDRCDSVFSGSNSLRCARALNNVRARTRDVASLALTPFLALAFCFQAFALAARARGLVIIPDLEFSEV